MVSTQTPLTCSRSDNLLPQSLLYNILTTKLAEAFEMTNMHALLCDYNDNLRSIKVWHLVLKLCSTENLAEIQLQLIEILSLFKLYVFQREKDQRGYNFTSNFPEHPHLDLVSSENSQVILALTSSIVQKFECRFHRNPMNHLVL